MPTYQHPGVYLEEIPSGVKPIEGVATCVVAFVGPAAKFARGPVGEAVPVNSLDEYEAAFGPLGNDPTEVDTMGLAVRAFYQNGGKAAYVVRAADSPTAAYAELQSEAPLNATSQTVLTVSATSPGEWGNGTYVLVESEDSLTFSLVLGHLELKEVGAKFVEDERFNNLSMNERAPNYAIHVVNGASRLVGLHLGNHARTSEPTATVGVLLGGTFPAETTTASQFKDVIGKLPSGGSVLNIDLDGRGVRSFKLTRPVLAGTSLDADGQNLAAAIQKAVRDFASSAPFSTFTCTWNSDKNRFEMTFVRPTGGLPVASSFSSIMVYNDSQKLAEALKLFGDEVTTTHGSSTLVPAEVPKPATGEVPEPPPGAKTLAGGTVAVPTGTNGWTKAFDALKKVRDVTVLVLPGSTMRTTAGEATISAAITHCEDMGNRMVIVDLDEGIDLITTPSALDRVNLSTSTYAACYYPWVNIPNPHYHRETNPAAKETLSIAPSAFAAGLWSRTDGRRGVWKAPAGVDAQLNGVAGLRFDVGDANQDKLNPEGINCIRKLPGFGAVIWGARTRATRANPEWRYVPVRRTAIMIEQSIYNGIQWAVFEPNDHRLWSSLRVNIGSFMDGLFRAGAFQGEKASDAYFVRCGLGDTMTQGDIDRGQVIAIVGFAPLKPAEFVIVRIQQKVQQ